MKKIFNLLIIGVLLLLPCVVYATEEDDLRTCLAGSAVPCTVNNDITLTSDLTIGAGKVVVLNSNVTLTLDSNTLTITGMLFQKAGSDVDTSNSTMIFGGSGTSLLAEGDYDASTCVPILSSINNDFCTNAYLQIVFDFSDVTDFASFVHSPSAVTVTVNKNMYVY